MFKRFLIFLVIAILLIPQGLSISYGAGSVQKLSHYQVSGIESITELNKSIYEGQRFFLYIGFVNNTGSQIKDISVLPNGSTPFSYYRDKASDTTVDDGEDFYVIVELAYNGGGQTFPFVLNYSDGVTSKSETYTAYINNIDEGTSQPPPSSSPDTSKYVPIPKITNQQVYNVSAGKSLDISLNVKNNSGHTGKNVTVRPLVNDVEGTPFRLDAANLSRSIDNFTGNQTVKLQFQIQTDALAVEKTYGLEFEFKGVNAYGHPFTATDIIYINVTNTNTVPRMMISQISLDPETIGPGGQGRLGIALKNSGTLDAKNLQITLEGLDSNGITLASDTNSRFIKAVRGGFVDSVTYDIQTSTRISNGNHKLSLKIVYQDEKNNTYTEEQTFFLPVGGQQGNMAEVEIRNIVAPKGELSTNDSFDISFDVANLGDASARNLKVTVDGGTALLPKSQNIQLIQNLLGKGKQSLNFSFYVSSEATSRNHPLLITLEYDKADGSGDKEEIKQYVGISVKEHGNKNTTPKIIIDQYSFDPGVVRAGETFDLAVSFLNTNQVKSVENIKIFLTVNESTNESGSVFTPVNSSNTFFIDSIGPRGRVEKNLTLYTIPDAKPKTYTITANFEYEDNEGAEYTAVELIGIPVVQQSRLEVNEIVLPPDLPMGYPLPIFLEFYNMGKVTLNNLIIKVEGNFSSQNGTYFVGNFEAGRSEYYEAIIFPNEIGPMTGDIIFAYEDSAGELVEVRKPISVSVYEMVNEFPGDFEFPIEVPKEPLIKRLLKNKILWAFIVIVAAAVGFIIWKKIKKRKGMEADEVY